MQTACPLFATLPPGMKGKEIEGNTGCFKQGKRERSTENQCIGLLVNSPHHSKELENPSVSLDLVTETQPGNMKLEIKQTE
jgi:hypothetical protein